jgi:DNA-directed RNA polymerase subunit F
MDNFMDIETNTFQLDKEFENCETCPNFQLFAIIKSNEILLKDSETNPILRQTKAYIERFNKYGLSEMSTKATDLKNLFNPLKDKLAHFEEAQLIDLLPLKAEEAYSLIPSLKEKLEEHELQSYLDRLKKMASY